MGLFGGMFSRMYYGNPNQPELKRKDIARENRFKLFFTVLGVRFWPLVILNLIFAVFWAPFLYVSIMFFVQLETAIESFGIMLVVTLAVALQFAGPVWSGMVYVIRTWADDEHAEMWSDLWLGVKKNWKSAVILNLINGLVMILFVMDVMFYFSGGFGAMAGVGILAGAMGWLMVLCCLVWLMMNMIMMPMAVRYDLKLRQVIKNALLLSIAELPRTLGIFLLSGGIFFGCLFLFVWAPFVSPLLMLPFVVVAMSLSLMISCSYANFLFDKYMRPDNQGAAE